MTKDEWKFVKQQTRFDGSLAEWERWRRFHSKENEWKAALKKDDKLVFEEWEWARCKRMEMEARKKTKKKTPPPKFSWIEMVMTVIVTLFTGLALGVAVEAGFLIFSSSQ